MVQQCLDTELEVETVASFLGGGFLVSTSLSVSHGIQLSLTKFVGQNITDMLEYQYDCKSKSDTHEDPVTFSESRRIRIG
jgi:hypothetical protein